jgi:hypothetical protein
VSSKESKRTLEILREVLVVFDIMDVPRIHQEDTYQFSDLYLPGKWSNSQGRGEQTNVTD